MFFSEKSHGQRSPADSTVQRITNGWTRPSTHADRQTDFNQIHDLQIFSLIHLVAFPVCWLFPLLCKAFKFDVVPLVCFLFLFFLLLLPLLFYFYLIFWLLWVFVAAHGFSSSCNEQGLLSVRSAQASPCGGCSCSGAQALGCAASAVVYTGLVAPQHVESSQTKGWTHVPCIPRCFVYHGTTREVPVTFAFDVKSKKKNHCQDWCQGTNPFCFLQGLLCLQVLYASLYSIFFLIYFFKFYFIFKPETLY